MNTSFVRELYVDWIDGL